MRTRIAHVRLEILDDETTVWGPRALETYFHEILELPQEPEAEPGEGYYLRKVEVISLESANCDYCDEPATHYGEGEYVCERHIYPAARGEYKKVSNRREAPKSDDRRDPTLILRGDWTPVLEDLAGWVVGLHRADEEPLDLLVTGIDWDDDLQDLVWKGVDVTNDDDGDHTSLSREARLRLTPDTTIHNGDVVAHELY